ncbi:hypothetical protein SAMN02910456_00157 [Ruminococcaceae bacterium YRB3002]|nr:hypothetical protein SAMN02910456_00157 [Ruminococcaceae bacterium YRB3002]
MLKRVINLSFIILFLLTTTCGCFSFGNIGSLDYHENVEELERFILSELGDYIEFYSPSIGSAYSVREGRTVEDEIVWHVVFLREYYFSKEKTSVFSPGEVIACFRNMYNSFMDNHPDYYLSCYNVYIIFDVPAERNGDNPPLHMCGYLTSYDFESWYNKNDQLTGVSLADEYWPYMYGQTDIEIAAMTDNSFVQIIEVAKKMPYLKKIIVHDQQVVDKASEANPNIVFVPAIE